MSGTGAFYTEPPGDASGLYRALYGGAVVRFGGLPEMAAIVAFARAFIEERLAPHPPPEIHRHHDHAALAELLAAAQKDHLRSDEANRLWRALFEAVGLPPEDTARDRLMLRFQPPTDRPWARSTATVGFHRDSWGTNLMAQVNWWAPVWPIDASRTFAIYPALWDRPIPNDSAAFDLAEVMERLKTSDPGRIQLAPRPTEPIGLEGGIPVVIDPGEIIAFSSAQAHVGVPNHTDLTRISLETRTLSISDTRAGRGAPNIDGRARWMAPGMFKRLSDGMPLDEVLGWERFMPFETRRST